MTSGPCFEAAGINRRTAQAYERLLTNLLVVEALPAWTSNRLKRLVLMPKRHLVDPALAGAVLGLDANLVLREGDLLGRLLDTFVVAQLRAELAVTAARPRLYHVRQQQGRLEVDLLAELAGGRLVAIEVKADAAPSPDAPAPGRPAGPVPRDVHRRCGAPHGPRTYRLGDRLVAAPIAALWRVTLLLASGQDDLPEHRRGCDLTAHNSLDLRWQAGHTLWGIRSG